MGRTVNKIDGLLVSSKIKDEVKRDVDTWVENGNRRPKLQVILVGNNTASKVYVGSKTTACKLVGIDSDTLYLPDTTSERELKQRIIEFNTDETIDGILVQLPLPSHMTPLAVIESIDFRK